MGVATVLARRAIFLVLALFLAVLLTGFILGITGYIDAIINAIINDEVRAYRQMLISLPQKPPPEELERLVSQYRQELIEYWGMDKPWYARIIPMVFNTLTLNLGKTQSPEVANVAGLAPNSPVNSVILSCLPRTIFMITFAEAIVILIALAVGPLVVYRIGSLTDRLVVAYAALMNAFPIWWVALVMLLVFSYDLRIAPTQFRPVISHIDALLSSMSDITRFDILKFREELVNVLSYVWLPMLTIVIVLTGPWIYSIRAMLIKIVKEDFVTAAVARGLPEKQILRRYIIRPAASPIVTSVLLGLAGTLGGYIITESVFDWPGMGTLYYAAVTGGDAPTILALTYIFTLVYVIARFILEMLYVILDPRVRL
ncbi:MAG: ABC transporter permease [Zestosphaera sp.]